MTTVSVQIGWALKAARSDVERLDRAVTLRRDPHERIVAEDRALGARRRLVRTYLIALLPEGKESLGAAVRLDSWLAQERIDADALDRLAAGLNPEKRNPNGYLG